MDEVTGNNQYTPEELMTMVKLSKVCQEALNKKYNFSDETDFKKYCDDIRALCLEHGYTTENMRMEGTILKMSLIPVSDDNCITLKGDLDTTISLIYNIDELYGLENDKWRIDLDDDGEGAWICPNDNLRVTSENHLQKYRYIHRSAFADEDLCNYYNHMLKVHGFHVILVAKESKDEDCT